MVGHIEVRRIARLQDDLRTGNLEHINDPPRILARLQQSCKYVECRGFPFLQQNTDEFRGFLLVHRFLVVAQHGKFRLADAAIGNGVQLLLFNPHFDAVTGHLIRRVPARPDCNIQGAGVDHAMRVVPAKGIADLYR